MTSRSAIAGALLLLSPSLAWAEPTPAAAPSSAAPGYADNDFHLSLGSGWELPIGRAESGLALRDVVAASVPIRVDASFRALPHVFVGAFVGWGFGAPADCPSDGRCRGRTGRFGFHGRYLFESSQGTSRPVPWIGLGAGFESLTTKVARSERAYQGVSYIDLQLGLDVPLGRHFAVGPNLSLAAGEFTQVTVEGAESADVEGEIAESRMHGWFLAGARLVFGS